MKKTIVSNLRNKKSNIAIFRNSAEKMSHFLAQEALSFIKEKSVSIYTPISKTAGSLQAQDIILIPILRAGLALLPTFLYYFEKAKVGFIGLKRDEKTFKPHEYYKNIPKIKKNDRVILLDPMLATGGSAVAAIEILKKMGAKEDQILCVFLISAPQGIKKLKDAHPKVKMIISIKDKTLNKNKYIVPGLGDFGDRYFGTN